MSTKQNITGLSEAEVEASRKQHGANVLTPPEKDPLWKQFLEKFSDPLIIILLVAGALSVGISIYEYVGLGQGAEVFFEPVGIFIAILLATGLAFYFEHQADKEFSLLNQVNDDEPVEVIRSGNTTQVPRRDIVVGDIVILNTGEEVPADATLLECTHLSADESTLTGELICPKTTNPDEFDPNATYPSNHVMKGTKVMEGHGVCQVTAVGDKTEQGKVFEAAQIDSSVKTPLNEQLDGLGDLITKMSYVIAGLIVVGRIITYLANLPTLDGFDWIPFVAYLLQTFMIAVTLIVVAVPEGLPMAVTLSLAYSMRSMLKTNNLVRKMHACETMGAASVICTDKTGTLTQNQMRVDEMKFYGLNGDAIMDDERGKLICEGMAVNSTAQLDRSDPQKPAVLGNPTEGALLLWLNAAGKNYEQLREGAHSIAEISFSTERKYMATVVESGELNGRKVVYVKGAPEIVFGLCSKADGGVTKETIDAQLLKYQSRAMRTLGFAYQYIDNAEDAISKDGKLVAKDLTFLGIASIADPVRADVPAAVKECLNAGIAIKIVTGDTPGTAKEIGRQIGLWTDKDTDANVITGPEFAALSDKEVAERAMDIKIISRARPMDKKRLVETLQAQGQVVAVTGDGTNDAPALKAAHVGLSMGDGTSVAKEASDITIVDNSFTSICRAVMWGRSLYQNIQRFLLFQLTVNVTACLLVLCGAFMSTESPLTVTQMLWINLIMDTFAAMALASLPPSESVMNDKPRDRKAFILSREMMVEIVSVGVIFFAILLGMLYVLKHAEINSMLQLITGDFTWLQEGHNITTRELTYLFTTFVMTHFFYLFNARAFKTNRSALHFKGCKGLLSIVAIIFIGQVVMVEFPGLQKFFNVEGISLMDWVIIVVGSSFVLWIREAWNLLTGGHK